MQQYQHSKNLLPSCNAGPLPCEWDRSRMHPILLLRKIRAADHSSPKAWTPVIFSRRVPAAEGHSITSFSYGCTCPGCERACGPLSWTAELMPGLVFPHQHEDSTVTPENEADRNSTKEQALMERCP